MHAHLISNHCADRRLKWTAPLRFVARILGGGIVLLSLNAVSAPANTQPTNAPAAAEAPLPKSVFDFDSKSGKDPFFPKSTRRVPTQPSAPRDTTPEVPDGVFQLQGVSIANGHKLAIINKRTLAEGEEMDVKMKAGVMRLKCVEIRERSVIISIRGTTQEIFLRPGL